MTAIIPVTKVQAQAVIDGLLTYLESKEGPMAKIATEALKASIDEALLPELWDYLVQRGIVTK